MTKRLLVAALALLVGGCGVSKKEYLTQVSRSQSLEAQLQETRARLDAEQARARELEASLARATAQAGKLSGDLEGTRKRLQECEAVVGQCRDEARGLSADLDVCQRSRRTAEQGLDACRKDLEEERAARSRERLEARTRLEECRGSVADLRARLSVLEEEKRRVEQEKREKLQEIAGTYEGLLEGLKKEVEAGRITIQQLKGKLSVNVLDEILFDSGSAVIKPEGREVLQRVGEILKEQTDKGIVIEGHTDNVPISGKLAEVYPTNWELSTARATSVVRFLQDVVGIPPERLSAVGYGPYRPVASNDTPEGRARNRRIEIKLVPLETPLFQPAPPPEEPQEAPPAEPGGTPAQEQPPQ